ncbi:hypothetical protein CE91St49_15860 [Emergencia timonensis]|nr:hypothetical protein CE91St48_15910 [Emergencia timonensis]BDF12239.1 hypothetical protein CE91St49_15860 [Emergencia timonensis]
MVFLCVKTLEFIILSAVCAGGTPNLFLGKIKYKQAKNKIKLGCEKGERFSIVGR